jgi:hypothetical protein
MYFRLNNALHRLQSTSLHHCGSLMTTGWTEPSFAESSSVLRSKGCVRNLMGDRDCVERKPHSHGKTSCVCARGMVAGPSYDQYSGFSCLWKEVRCAYSLSFAPTMRSAYCTVRIVHHDCIALHLHSKCSTYDTLKVLQIYQVMQLERIVPIIPSGAAHFDCVCHRVQPRATLHATACNRVSPFMPPRATACHPPRATACHPPICCRCQVARGVPWAMMEQNIPHLFRVVAMAGR